jgi:hypothetical protein
VKFWSPWSVAVIATAFGALSALFFGRVELYVLLFPDLARRRGRLGSHHPAAAAPASIHAGEVRRGSTRSHASSRALAVVAGSTILLRMRAGARGVTARAGACGWSAFAAGRHSDHPR